MPQRSIDLNADLGEGAGTDAELLAVITSASVACGAHAGSVALMRETALRAAEHSVAIGAHPGYPDSANFGRIEIGATAAQIERWVTEQIALLRDVCADAGATVRYVKAHGALYNRATRDAEAAAAIVAAVQASDTQLFVLAPDDSEMLLAAKRAGIRTAREAFLDRAYARDGTLVPRTTAGAVISDAGTAAERAVSLTRGEPISDIAGRPLGIRADSLCVHGDSPAAVAIVRAVKQRLSDAGIALHAFA